MSFVGQPYHKNKSSVKIQFNICSASVKYIFHRLVSSHGLKSSLVILQLCLTGDQKNLHFWNLDINAKLKEKNEKKQCIYL